MDEEPRILDMGDAVRGLQNGLQRLFVLHEQRVDQIVLGGEVVVEIAGADAQFGRDRIGRHPRLSKAVEQRQTALQNALSRAARCLFGRHACLLVPSCLLLWLLE